MRACRTILRYSIAAAALTVAAYSHAGNSQEQPLVVNGQYTRVFWSYSYVHPGDSLYPNWWRKFYVNFRNAGSASVSFSYQLLSSDRPCPVVPPDSGVLIGGRVDTLPAGYGSEASSDRRNNVDRVWLCVWNFREQ
jgi:hypothetical protein